MGRTTRLGALLALVVGLSVSTWGVGTSGAQEHHGDHGDDHGTTTTAPATTSTTAPATTTTAPATTTTAPATTTTEHGEHGGGDDHHGNPTTTVPGSTTSTTAVPGTPGGVRASIRYGPYTVPGADAPEGGAGHGHAHTGSRFAYFVQKPCENCFITSMQADLVHADGSRAGWSTGSQLHHVALANWSWRRTDATCFAGSPYPVGLLLGQRFFGSADDRTAVRFPRGYGYRVRSADVWNLVWDLAGEAPDDQEVFVQMTYEWVPASRSGVRDVEPVWLDVEQCDDSMVSVAQGPGSKSSTWNVNRPGNVVAVGAFGHEGTQSVAVKNDTTGQVICDSRPAMGGDPVFTDPYHGLQHISSMSTCTGNPVARLRRGQRVSLTASYDMAKAVDDQMGVALAYVAGSGR